ncbi:MAG: hypothetical protein H6R02_2465 [Burkholderiaceae bacterium]|jgi:hypothetical protein|nr:hypothetical protein [Burkholderiaceae bacterium]
MARADAEQRALRQELLLVRAAVERAALADQLGRLESRSSHGLPGLLFAGADGARRSGLLRFATSTYRVVRSQPWLVPTVAGIARSRALRWLVLAGAVAAAAWWIRNSVTSSSTADREDEAEVVAPDSGFE